MQKTRNGAGQSRNLWTKNAHADTLPGLDQDQHSFENLGPTGSGQFPDLAVLGSLPLITIYKPWMTVLFQVINEHYADIIKNLYKK